MDDNGFGQAVAVGVALTAAAEKKAEMTRDRSSGRRRRPR
jgi:hypothetical protein